MMGDRDPVLSGWRWIAGFALAYGALAEAALALARSTAGIAIVWPASGVAAAAVLLLTAPDRKRFLACIFAASVATNALNGSTLIASTGFAVANCVEASVLASIVRAGRGGILAFDAPRQILRFTAGAVIAALLSALVATPFAAAGASLDFFRSWAMTVGLGIMIVAPTILTWARDHARPREDNSFTWRNAVMGTAVLIVSLICFLQSNYPLLFLPVIMVTLATYFLGSTGAVRSIVTVALVGTVAGSFDLGPVSMIGDNNQIGFFQFYLLCLIASAMPLATLLTVARTKDGQIAESKYHLEAAEHLASLGNWHLDLRGETIRWSPEMFRIYGLPERPFATRRDAIEGFHPEDRPHIARILERAVKDQRSFDFSGRVLRPDGSMRHVQGRGDVIVENGQSRALFGIVHDVTEKTLLLEELLAARQAAERQALVMEHLANTDPLTGLANRRRALAELENQIEHARKTGGKLAIVMVDVDHFKTINDRFGHDVGDRVLTAIAEVAPVWLSPGDLFARIGGEEFLAVLPGRDGAGALAMAEMVRQAVARLSENEPDLPQVSVSLGAAILGPNDHRDALLKAADLALYQAKAEGRNRSALAA